jgi:hypothetical protein
MPAKQSKRNRSSAQTRKKFRYSHWEVGITLWSGAAVLALVWWLIESEHLVSLRDAEAARSLITFLFSLGTMSLFVIISYNILTEENSTESRSSGGPKTC